MIKCGGETLSFQRHKLCSNASEEWWTQSALVMIDETVWKAQWNARNLALLSHPGKGTHADTD